MPGSVASGTHCIYNHKIVEFNNFKLTLVCF
jgi:hypothetical protein